MTETSLHAAVRALDRDPHTYGQRPCETCRAVSRALGMPFGCVRVALGAPR